MKKFAALFILSFVSILAYSQNEIERIFLFKSKGEYYVRVEVPYFYDLATPENKLVIEVPGTNIRHEVTMEDMNAHQTQNEFTDYVAVYDFPIGHRKLFRFKELKCLVTFDYKQMEELYSLEFHKFVWL
jgi:hypothetical protein